MVLVYDEVKILNRWCRKKANLGIEGYEIISVNFNTNLCIVKSITYGNKYNTEIVKVIEGIMRGLLYVKNFKKLKDWNGWQPGEFWW